MGDHDDLGIVGQTGQTLADLVRHRAADAAIDLVKDQGSRLAVLRQGDLQGQHHARELATRGNLVQGPGRTARIGGDVKGNAVPAFNAPAILVPSGNNGFKHRLIQGQGRQFSRHDPIEFFRRLDAPLA